MAGLLYLGGFGFLSGALFGFVGGFRRFWLLFALGLLLVAAFLLTVYLTAPTDASSDCHDCSEFHGRWIDGVVVIIAFFNLIGYALGVVAGAALRRSRQERPA